jgi:hypothetical protein
MILSYIVATMASNHCDGKIATDHHAAMAFDHTVGTMTWDHIIAKCLWLTLLPLMPLLHVIAFVALVTSL